MLRSILRCYVGNDSAAKMDETALGPWVSVVRKSSNNRKDLFKKTKKSFLGQVPQTAPLTVANAFSEVFPAPWL